MANEVMTIVHPYVKKYETENSSPRVKKDRLFALLFLADFFKRREEERLDVMRERMRVAPEETLELSAGGSGFEMSNAPAPYPAILFSCFFTNR